MMDSEFRKLDLPCAPDWLKKRILNDARLAQYGVDFKFQLNDVAKFIGTLKARGIPYEVVEDKHGVVRALYWVDPELLTRRDTIRFINIVVHDDTHGMLDPAAVFTKFSVLASSELSFSQILICGCSFSSLNTYYYAIWKLFHRVFGDANNPELFIQPATLITMSDEDGAFLKATREAVRDGLLGMSVVKQVICVWHKYRNVAKPRTITGVLQVKHVTTEGGFKMVEMELPGEEESAKGSVKVVLVEEEEEEQ